MPNIIGKYDVLQRTIDIIKRCLRLNYTESTVRFYPETCKLLLNGLLIILVSLVVMAYVLQLTYFPAFSFQYKSYSS